MKTWLSKHELSNAEHTHPPDGNVMPMQQDLNKLAKEIREANNLVVHLAAEADKVEAQREQAEERLRAAQMRMVEHCRHLGIRAEVVQREG